MLFYQTLIGGPIFLMHITNIPMFCSLWKSYLFLLTIPDLSIIVVQSLSITPHCFIFSIIVNLKIIVRYILQFNRKSVKIQLKIKSTVEDWGFMPWKFNSRLWKCFESLKWCFLDQICKKNHLKSEKIVWDWRINR